MLLAKEWQSSIKINEAQRNYRLRKASKNKRKIKLAITFTLINKRHQQQLAGNEQLLPNKLNKLSPFMTSLGTNFQLTSNLLNTISKLLLD